jgi:hypothetical protein
MKLLLLSFIYDCLCGYSPALVNPAVPKNVELIIQTCIYDTTELQIQVVHNPKYATTYGIKLINKDTIHTLRIQKVKLGSTEKNYLEDCQRNESEFGGIFEFCVLKPQYDSIFALEVSDSTRLKCEVYYTNGSVSKRNATEVVEMIACMIGFSYGIASHSITSPCIWSIGWGQ